LRDNCDEFIYYEDLERIEQEEQQTAVQIDAGLPERQREAFGLLIEACKALRRENHENLFASMIKETIKRKKPSFDESYYGYRSFSHMLETADDQGIVDIERNPKSGTYVVVSFLSQEPKAEVAEHQGNAPASNRRSSSGSSSRGGRNRRPRSGTGGA
jgi:hypothetical protein